MILLGLYVAALVALMEQYDISVKLKKSIYEDLLQDFVKSKLLKAIKM